MSDELDALRERVRVLEDELAALKAGDTSENDSDARGKFTDRRDDAVIEHLDHGETVRVSRIKSLYRIHTDVRAEGTLQTRIKSLTATPLFQYKDPGIWTFVGEDTDE